MKHLTASAAGTLVLLIALVPGHAIAQSTHDAWRSIFDGSSLDGWDVVGDANWELIDDTVHADSGFGYLVTKESFGDFQLKLDFWVDPNANSGIFMRCSDRNDIQDSTCYEANIFDTRKDQKYRTASIVNFAKPSRIINTGNQWNTYLITLKGSRILVELNGSVTVDIENNKYKRGPIALQYGRGTVKFRKVQIMPLED